ncbi:MAG: DNA polymerase III subunit gamma/tau [Bacteroidales bacterium]|nr:DNA polymerase III subunit gamma/tau [Bacteroidales bacterium]
MPQFIVSARKYRPSSFTGLIGQDNIARTLKNSILTGQLAHSYLFCGPRGVGKTSTARIFAKTINCMNPGPDMEPCGECESCRSFAEGRSYCIHELDAASNNSVDDIRNLTEQVRIPPQIGRYSVYIIDEVHMLSQAAFNAFLKTLEEPPAHAIFILATTEKHKILPTILSRCQTYDFNRISVADMVRNMKEIAAAEQIAISDDALHIIAQKADGAMRDALTLFDQTVAFCGNDITYDMVIKNLNVLDYEYYFRLTDYFLAGDYPACLLLFDEILSKGFNSLHFISGLSSHFRDMIVCSNSASRVLAELAPSIVAKYDEYSRKCSIKFLYEALGITTACEAAYKASGNGRLLIEFALMKLCALRGELPQGDLQGTAPVAAPVAAPAAAPAPAVTPAAAPAPAPAPAPAAEPAPAPAAKPKAAAPEKEKSASSISNLLKKAMQAEKAPAPESEPAIELLDDDVPTPEVEISDSRLADAWKAVTDNVDNPRVRSGLVKFSPVYDKATNTVTQFVLNAAQKEWLERNLLVQLQADLQKALDRKDVSLKFDFKADAQADDTRKPYTTREVADAMRAKNRDLAQMEAGLDLEIK